MPQDENEQGSTGLSQLLARHRAELQRFLVARCGSAYEAEDFLQEMWLKVGQAQTGPIANGRAYLFRMANNLVADAARARHRAMRRDHAWLDQDGGGATAPEERVDMAEPADEAIARRQESEVLQQAIDALPEGARRALRLYRFEGMGQAEIARTLGISRSGVEKHLALAMKRLRNSLADCGYLVRATSEGSGGLRGGEPREEHDL